MQKAPLVVKTNVEDDQIFMLKNRRLLQAYDLHSVKIRKRRIDPRKVLNAAPLGVGEYIDAA